MKLSEKEFIEAEIKMGLHYGNPNFKKLAQKTCDQIKDLNIDSIIDYGCGTGTYSQVLLENGLNVTAQDISKEHRDYIKKHHPDVKVVLRPVKSDLMYFIEVAEHMTDEEIEKAIEKIDPAYIVFSSTSQKTKNDAVWGHINIKEQEDWINFWNEKGYIVEKPLKYPTAWSLLLKKI
jgi:2-polyprenyl-3-methyl-5-hydroxy-6-metoxy-1,4-benzoquinol methylase